MFPYRPSDFSLNTSPAKEFDFGLFSLDGAPRLALARDHQMEFRKWNVAGSDRLRSGSDAFSALFSNSANGIYWNQSELPDATGITEILFAKKIFN